MMLKLLSFTPHPEFIEDESAKCQKQARLDFVSQEFEEATQLVDYLNAKGCRATSNADMARVLQTIAETEDHPKLLSVGGIDLKYICETCILILIIKSFLHIYRLLYKTLANLSMGHPTMELNKDSHIFLNECYHEIQQELGTTEGKQKLERLRTDMFGDVDQSTNNVPSKIVPHGVTPSVNRAMTSCAMNPLQVPLAHLIRK